VHYAVEDVDGYRREVDILIWRLGTSLYRLHWLTAATVDQRLCTDNRSSVATPCIAFTLSRLIAADAQLTLQAAPWHRCQDTAPFYRYSSENEELALSLYTVSQKKGAFLFSLELCQISTNFNTFW